MLRGPRCYTVIRRNTDYEHQNIHKHYSALETQGNFKQIEIPLEVAETPICIYRTLSMAESYSVVVGWVHHTP